jgi:pilus assembly protein Flp/PilA
MKRTFGQFLKDDSGATAIEYALLAGLIAVAIVGGAAILGTELGDFFQRTAGKFPT